MRISYFRSIRGQPSMDRFVRELSAAVASAAPGTEAALAPPDDFPRRPFHWRKYISYQLAARRWALDVNHVVDHGYAHLVLSLPLRRSVVTVHDMGPLWAGRGRLGGREGGAATAAAYRYSLLAMRRAAAVVAVSEATRRELLEYTGWPEERVITIHSGIGAGFRPVADPGPALHRLNLSGFPYLLHVGDSGARKNLATVLRALAELPGELRLVKTGASLQPPERRLAESLLPGRVIETGPLTDAELPALYSGAEALVFPSLYEGFGWPPLEAMACGTPAVVSGVGALAEIAGPGALVVDDPHDHRALAAAALRCLRSSPERSTLAARGMARAAEFSWERTARAYLDVYLRVAETAAK